MPIKQLNITQKDTYVIGDLHGEFNLLGYLIKESKLEDACIIIAGDCGFGFEKPPHYEHMYNRMKDILIKNNILILFVRGNHDDPTYFGGVNNIDFEYFKTIEDYSLLHLNEGSSVLCIGGGISIDRRFRRQGESYWKDELPVFRPDLLNYMYHINANIKTVITHTAPSFVPLYTKIGVESFIEKDPTLEKDMDSERRIMDQIYYNLEKYSLNKVTQWFYGHFHGHGITMYEDIKFVMLDIVNPHFNKWDIHKI